MKSFEVCQLPVRCARFIVRKQWFITASDDMHMRVYNYNTMEKVQIHVYLHMCIKHVRIMCKECGRGTVFVTIYRSREQRKVMSVEVA